MSRLLLTLFCAACALPALAAEDDANATAELARASHMREEASALRSKADADLAAETQACQARFLVNRCIANAKEARLGTVAKARALEIEARRIELAQQRLDPAVAGRSRTDAPAQPAAPNPLDTLSPPADPAATATRQERNVEAGRAAKAASAARAQKDAEKTRARQAAETDAAARAQSAAQDRARYDERRQKRDAERAKAAAKAAAHAQPKAPVAGQ